MRAFPIEGTFSLARALARAPARNSYVSCKPLAVSSQPLALALSLARPRYWLRAQGLTPSMKELLLFSISYTSDRKESEAGLTGEKSVWYS